MGLLQRAVETYDANAACVGVYREGRDPLAPIGHILTSAQLEITLNAQGQFLSARKIGTADPKILIPATEASAGRTSGLVAHPLCDQLKYVACTNPKAHELYLEELRKWISSAYSHPFLPAVYAYAASGTILDDLTKSGILAPDQKGRYDEKLLVRWRIPDVGDEEPACWKNQHLFSAFAAYYCEKISARNPDLCMIEGQLKPTTLQHPKGIIPVNGNAKLISSNDSAGFTYRGRFSEERQAVAVSYDASQKAHNALRWLVSDQGVQEFAGNRIFLCWNPQGKSIPRPMRIMRREGDAAICVRPSDYQKQLCSTLLSFRQDHQLCDTDVAVLVSFDAATTGRLAVTDYNEISMKTFLNRMHTWDAHCCWYAGQQGIQAPNLFRLVDCAFGTQHGGRLETDDRIKRRHLQRLLDCKVSGGIFPSDIVRALTQRASTPQMYDEKNWRRVLHAACAALQKYRYDTNQGGNEMAWELDKKDRSFQFGRLLAVMERLEEDYYQKAGETRQSNAIRYMEEYRRRPFSVFERLNRHLKNAYECRVAPWQAKRYNRLSDEIFGILLQCPEKELNRPLDDIYLMGYELQRNAFFAKGEKKGELEEE